jgi:hypothetical protein
VIEEHAATRSAVVFERERANELVAVALGIANRTIFSGVADIA